MKEKKQQINKGVNTMPVIELIERERVAYVQEMDNYLQCLKKMTKQEAKKVSYENLVRSEIITENGEFTERYEFTRMISKKVR